MSRIGKKRVTVPSGVTVEVNSAARTIKASGPKGSLVYDWHEFIDVASGDDGISCNIVESHASDRSAKAQWGTTRSRIQNMVTGVRRGLFKAAEDRGRWLECQGPGQAVAVEYRLLPPSPSFAARWSRVLSREERRSHREWTGQTSGWAVCSKYS